MIKTIYKVEGDDNEYQSKQQALVAEVLSKISDIYINDRQRLKIAQGITKQYFLSLHFTEPTNKESDKELDSWGPSA